MACFGVEALVDDPALDVVFVYNPLNTRLTQRLAGIPNLQKRESPCTTHKFQGFANRISKKKVRPLAQLFKQRFYRG